MDITAIYGVIFRIGDNFEATALITTTLKHINIPKVIAVSNSRHRGDLLRIGADRVILLNKKANDVFYY